MNIKLTIALCLIFAIATVSAGGGKKRGFFSRLVHRGIKKFMKKLGGKSEKSQGPEGGKPESTEKSQGSEGAEGESSSSSGSETPTSSDELKHLQDMDADEYDQFKQAASDELNQIFQPDSVARIMDALDEERYNNY